jgi:nitrate/nitrite transporter NarK
MVELESGNSSSGPATPNSTDNESTRMSARSPLTIFFAYMSLFFILVNSHLTSHISHLTFRFLQQLGASLTTCLCAGSRFRLIPLLYPTRCFFGDHQRG